MIRHISIFFLKEEDKEHHLAAMRERLEQLRGELTHVAAYTVGTHAGEKPPAGIPGVPEFGDLVQMIDFETEEAAASYAAHPAHQKLVAATGDYIEKVVAMDVALRG